MTAHAEPVVGGLVSVVMAAFDEEAFIGEALASVLGQSYGAVEVIVVDDGSGDRTAEVAAGYGVRLVRRPHVGAAAARNEGLAVACGEFWTIFDADDVMPRERIACQVEHLRSHPEDGMVLGLTEAFVSPGEPRPAHFNPAWDEGPFPGHAGTMLARREVFAAVGPYNEALHLGEDLEWQARAREAGIQAGHVDQVCLRYRIHRANTSADTSANRVATLHLLRESVHRRRAHRADAW